MFAYFSGFTEMFPSFVGLVVMEVGTYATASDAFLSSSTLTLLCCFSLPLSSYSALDR